MSVENSSEIIKSSGGAECNDSDKPQSNCKPDLYLEIISICTFVSQSSPFRTYGASEDFLLYFYRHAAPMELKIINMLFEVSKLQIHMTVPPPFGIIVKQFKNCRYKAAEKVFGF
jgi:hypothetical protein